MMHPSSPSGFRRTIRLTSAVSLLMAFLLLAAPLAVASADSATLPVITAKAAVLMDAQSGDLLYALNEDVPLYAAGLGSMMTALLTAEAIERGDIAKDDVVTASNTSHNDITADASIQNIVPGESMTVESLLCCMLVGGASEACNILAEHVAGSQQGFVAQMNERAEALGCRNTHFVNTHGLPSEAQFSSAYDLARIAAAFTRHDYLMELSSTLQCEIPATNVAEARYLSNSNLILRTDYTRYYYSYARGIKSSHTEAAGYCLASSVKTDDHYVVSIVLGCQLEESSEGYFDIQSYIQTRRLFRWFFENYSLRNVVSTLEPLVEVPLAMGEGMDTVVACSDEALSLFLPNNLDLRKEYTRSIRIYSQEPDAEPLTAPVYRGQVLGEMTVTSASGRLYGPFTLIANTDVAVSRFEVMKLQIRTTLNSKWVKLTALGLGLLLALYIAFVIRYNTIRARRRRELRQQEEQERRVRTVPKR